MDNRNICSGGVYHADGGVMDSPILNRTVAKATKFRGVMSCFDAARWQQKYTDAGFDLVEVDTDGLYYTCRAVKYA
jgi:hypothetical protein